MIDTAPAPAAQLSPEALAQVRIFQQNEVTESEVYRRIAAGTKDESNRAALLRIADEEAKHAAIWQRYTGEARRRPRSRTRSWRKKRPRRWASAPTRNRTSRRCWRCWTRSACRTWAAWCWA